MKKQITNVRTKDRVVQVTGRAIVILGFESYQFTIHRRVTETEPIIQYDKDYWTITEHSTGMTVFNYADTQKFAIAGLTERLNGKGKEAFANMVQGALIQATA